MSYCSIAYIFTRIYSNYPEKSIKIKKEGGSKGTAQIRAEMHAKEYRSALTADSSA
jgi:hypothetical protein